MSNPHLLPELFDQVVDYLHDTDSALRNCCLVSKSWIPQARKHLFANVRFETEEDLESWKERFRDPLTSPAHYAKTLLIHCCSAIAAAAIETGSWIRCFSRIVHLKLKYHDESRASLLPALHGISPFVKSLHVEFVPLPSSQVFDFVLSFPLLEDLTVVSSSKAVTGNDDCSGGLPTVVQPSAPSMFTGSLNLLSCAGTEPIARRLLNLPAGIHFRYLTLTWVREEDISLTSALVERCSHTLESLDITCEPRGMPVRHLCPSRCFIFIFS